MHAVSQNAYGGPHVLEVVRPTGQRRVRARCGARPGRGSASGHIRSDLDATDLFTLVNAIGWISNQGPSIAARRDHRSS
jgi:hypothetical protein